MKNFFIVLKDMYENRTYIHQIEAESIEEATNQTLDIYVDYLSISRDAIKILSVTEGELGDENVVRDLQDAYSLFNLHA